MIKVHMLLGGLTTFGDGVITSRGMYGLAKQIRALGRRCDVATYQWAKYLNAHAAIHNDGHRNKVVLIGYSGGGSRATWLALELHPVIDLMVLYDPSPKWQMKPIYSNVKRAICYYNTAPRMFGLGGGKLIGTFAENIAIAQQHLTVQYDQALHAHTLRAISAL